MQTTLHPPKNQYALVLHTLMHPPKELDNGYWMKAYKSYKFSTRLGELEQKLGINLVHRQQRDFVNRFGHKSNYVEYIPYLTRTKYLEYYTKINN